MKKVIMFFSISLVVLFLFVSAAALISASQTILVPQESSNHTEWIARSLRKIRTVKVGMTRKDLLGLFQTEGGVFTRTSRKFVFRECPYIKVDVEFEPVGAPEDNVKEYPDDRIINISKPYLEQSIID